MVDLRRGLVYELDLHVSSEPSLGSIDLQVVHLHANSH